MGLAWLDWTGLDWTFEFQWKSSTKKLNTFLWTSLPLLCHYSSSDSKMQMVHSMHTRSLSAYFNPRKQADSLLVTHESLLKEMVDEYIHTSLLHASINYVHQIHLRTILTTNYKHASQLFRKKNFFSFIFHFQNEKWERECEREPLNFTGSRANLKFFFGLRRQM